VALSDDFIQGNRTHPGCEGRIRKLGSSNICRYLIGISIIE
jgi:hypothetical protein